MSINSGPAGKLMKCGCVTYAINLRTKEPVCPVHSTSEQEKKTPDLDGRMAKCREGKCEIEKPSSWALPMFRYTPLDTYKKELGMDSYYCGCRGWN